MHPERKQRVVEEFRRRTVREMTGRQFYFKCAFDGVGETFVGTHVDKITMRKNIFAAARWFWDGRFPSADLQAETSRGGRVGPRVSVKFLAGWECAGTANWHGRRHQQHEQTHRRDLASVRVTMAHGRHPRRDGNAQRTQDCPPQRRSQPCLRDGCQSFFVFATLFARVFFLSKQNTCQGNSAP